MGAGVFARQDGQEWWKLSKKMIFYLTVINVEKKKFTFIAQTVKNDLFVKDIILWSLY